LPRGTSDGLSADDPRTSRLMTRAYRWQLEHTPWKEMIRSWSPSMVIITTPTACPSAAATHSAQT